METRGIRNCNPLNIRKSGSQWKGMRENQTDKEFVQFNNMIYGIRAAIITLRTYFIKHNINTIGEIINRWAPSKENDTREYIIYVCRNSQLGTEWTPIIWNNWNIYHLVVAMAKYESKYLLSKGEFDTAWNMT